MTLKRLLLALVCGYRMYMVLFFIQYTTLFLYAQYLNNISYFVRLNTKIELIP